MVAPSAISSIMIFPIDPSTLSGEHSDFSWILELYRKYKDDLEALCLDMVNVRKRMLEDGCSADFSDREAEVLYLIIRELKPDVVVEISPCYGYSTNYILAALTANGSGQLHSYEIMESFKDRLMPDVICRNLSRFCDSKRLHLYVGDATKAQIPACDFLFLDSCHEAYFSAWYFSHLIERSKMVFIHDILVFDKGCKALVPKAALLGIRESYYVLETLKLNREKLFYVADFDHAPQDIMRPSMPVRMSGASNRGIVIRGHAQSPEAKALHRTQAAIEEIKQLIIAGDRVAALDKIQTLCDGDSLLFSKLQAVLLLPQLGYRYPFYESVFPKMEFSYNLLSVPEFAAFLEMALSSCNFGLLRSIVRKSSQSKMNKGTRKYLTQGYLGMANMRFLRKLKNLKPRIKKFVQYLSLVGTSRV